MKRSIYLSDEDEKVLDLLISETGAKVSELVAVSLRDHLHALGYKYVPSAWVKGGEACTN